jgi:hypothetical protein
MNAKNIEKEFMIAYIKNHWLALLLIGIVVLTILRIEMPLYGGYTGTLYLSLFCTEGIRYIFIIICAIAIPISGLNRKRKVLTSLAVVLLIAVGLIPTGHFMTLGALLSLQNANPEQIRDDARILINQFESPTHFTNDTNQRILFNEFVPKDRLPLSLQNEVLNDILVLKDAVFIEKFGLSGQFRGFVVFREGSDIWKDEKPIALLDGCPNCWKMRIIDGLYWYHAVPTEEEIPTVFSFR